MQSLVIFDSVFGNTEQIARAIGAALGTAEEAPVKRVSEVKPEELGRVSLLVIGSPTRGFRPTEGIQALLKGIPAGALKGIRVAGFDTRMEMVDIKNPFFRFIVDKGGYAAKIISESLVKAGGERAAEPAGFFVAGEQGPLKNYQLERAVEWAKGLK